MLDADDSLYPEAAGRVVSAFAPGVGTVQHRLHLVDAEGAVIDRYPAAEVRFDRGDVVSKLLATGRYEGTVTSGLAFTRATLSAILPIPAERFRIGADGYLVTAAPFHGTVAAIDEPLGAYRRQGFRRALLHDADKHRVLSEWAAARGLVVPLEPGMRDYQHVGVRLGSLILEPDLHPSPRTVAPGSPFAAPSRRCAPRFRRPGGSWWRRGTSVSACCPGDSRGACSCGATCPTRALGP